MLNPALLNAVLLAGKAQDFWSGILGLVFFVICLVLIFLVLIQKGADAGGGLGAAFGGGGGSDSLFGVKAAAGIKYITAYVAISFMVMCLILAKVSTGSRISDGGSDGGEIELENDQDTNIPDDSPGDENPEEGDETVEDSPEGSENPEDATPEETTPEDDAGSSPAPGDDGETDPNDGGNN